jgi:hypothetical protein
MGREEHRTNSHPVAKGIRCWEKSTVPIVRLMEKVRQRITIPSAMRGVIPTRHPSIPFACHVRAVPCTLQLLSHASHVPGYATEPRQWIARIP